MNDLADGPSADIDEAAAGAATTIIRHVDKTVIDNGRALIESVAGPFKSRTLKRPVDGTDAQITLGQSYFDFVAGNPNLPETTVPPSE